MTRSKIPRYFIEIGLLVNAVVVTDSTLINNMRLIGSITSRHVAIMGINFDIFRSLEIEKSDSM